MNYKENSEDEHISHFSNFGSPEDNDVLPVMDG